MLFVHDLSFFFHPKFIISQHGIKAVPTTLMIVPPSEIWVLRTFCTFLVLFLSFSSSPSIWGKKTWQCYGDLWVVIVLLLLILASYCWQHFRLWCGCLEINSCSYFSFWFCFCLGWLSMMISFYLWWLVLSGCLSFDEFFGFYQVVKYRFWLLKLLFGIMWYF